MIKSMPFFKGHVNVNALIYPYITLTFWHKKNTLSFLVLWTVYEDCMKVFQLTIPHLMETFIIVTGLDGTSTMK